ncbi:MAG: U32 family peptidase [Clostridia bacterium]|nr:U32 family peptidase [Clostridia bacterium]
MSLGRKPELLCPARDPEVLRAAVDYGADAVYIGGEAFSLRSKATNFTRDQIAQGCAYAHKFGKRVHVAANILAHEADIEKAADYFKELNGLDIDAVLVADPGMFMLCREYCPGREIHISTQASLTNHLSFDFWYRQGAKRVVCARELSLEEIKSIRHKTDPGLEIEAFVHGSMCVSYSGRCLLSNYFAGRDANRGECSHPCRWKYAVVEESRPGQYLPLEENDRGTYIFDSGDMCMIHRLKDICEAGVDSLKIEGRMKTPLYVATVARAYRHALDDLFEDEEKYQAKVPEYLREIKKCTYRPFNTGFYYGRPGSEGMKQAAGDYLSGAVWIGIVEKVRGAEASFIQRNRFFVGEEIEAMKRDGRNIPLTVASIRAGDGTLVQSAPHPLEDLSVTFVSASGAPAEGVLEPGDVLRRIDS